MAKIHPTYWKFEHKNKDGEVIWDQDWTQNALADEGEEDILDVYFRGAAAPASFYVRLFNDTPVETDSISDLTNEPSGNGYAAQTIERSAVGWPTLALDSGDFRAVSKTVTFTASGGDWDQSVTNLALTTSTDSSGLLVAYVALSATRTLTNGDSLDVTTAIKLS